MTSFQTSLGPVMLGIPDPAGYGAGSQLFIVTLMDCSSGTQQQDWYASGHPTTYDRGVRNTSYNNTYEGGNWMAPAPDGLGRWQWGDTANNTGCWIDGANKHGFILVPSFGAGDQSYVSSQLTCESRNYEIQVFDPAQIGAAKNGTRAAWDVRPASRWVVDLPGMPGSGGPFHPPGNAAHNPLCQYR